MIGRRRRAGCASRRRFGLFCSDLTRAAQRSDDAGAGRSTAAPPLLRLLLRLRPGPPLRLLPAPTHLPHPSRSAPSASSR